MAKVTYLGQSYALEHKACPGGPIFFISGVPMEVTPEQAAFYQKEAERGGPWAVEMGKVEAVAHVVKEKVSRKK